MHAFDDKFKQAVTDLYADTVRLYEDAGITVPNFGPLQDINDLAAFIAGMKSTISPVNWAYGYTPPPPKEVTVSCPEALAVWMLLDSVQRAQIVAVANDLYQNPSMGEQDKTKLKKSVAGIIDHPQGTASRLARLISEIQKYLSEPYAFDVFAPNSYNFGLMITYRQKWEPGAYQAGDLVATIPLAPNETRKFSKKQVVKKSRAEKEIEKSMSSRSLQSSQISRAEAEIMQKATTATNFKMTASGSFNISVGSINASSELAVNQAQESARNKKEFHEATVKAAEEYRLERTMEVDTTSAVETEEASSGEISNPNNEITVTYLFYELQRRFTIQEFLYRVRPVILIAQDVPAPHEIDEAWLIQYQWILSRVLLDDSLRPALEYLTSGFAGDEVSIEIIKAHWEAQVSLAQSLEGKLKGNLTALDAGRIELQGRQIADAAAAAERTTNTIDIAKEVLTGGGPLNLLTGGVASLFGKKDPIVDAETSIAASADAEAQRKAAETRLQYFEQAVADTQEKLRGAMSTFEQATNDYAKAMQNQFARHVAIDQLRLHVKQNILYYMQAIWDHEPPDQRFFRLYNQLVYCPQPDPQCSSGLTALGKSLGQRPHVEIPPCPPETNGPKVQLVDIADLDNPLGYKGNYIIFPLKGECYLTTYMLTEFIDNYLGVHDPDGSDDFDAETFDLAWNEAAEKDKDKLKADLVTYITAVRRSTDEIIVPTGQLFIEALPGSHPLLEDFKLLHRMEDVRKVKAEVRHAELENLRLASRLVGGQAKPKLLEDPDIDRKIVVDGNATTIVGP